MFDNRVIYFVTNFIALEWEHKLREFVKLKYDAFAGSLKVSSEVDFENDSFSFDLEKLIIEGSILRVPSGNCFLIRNRDLIVPA